MVRRTLWSSDILLDDLRIAIHRPDFKDRSEILDRLLQVLLRNRTKNGGQHFARLSRRSIGFPNFISNPQEIDEDDLATTLRLIRSGTGASGLPVLATAHGRFIFKMINRDEANRWRSLRQEFQRFMSTGERLGLRLSLFPKQVWQTTIEFPNSEEHRNFRAHWLTTHTHPFPLPEQAEHARVCDIKPTGLGIRASAQCVYNSSREIVIDAETSSIMKILAAAYIDCKFADSIGLLDFSWLTISMQKGVVTQSRLHGVDLHGCIEGKQGECMCFGIIDFLMPRRERILPEQGSNGDIRFAEHTFTNYSQKQFVTLFMLLGCGSKAAAVGAWEADYPADDGSALEQALLNALPCMDAEGSAHHVCRERACDASFSMLVDSLPDSSVNT
eukprot:g4647.t1